MWVYLRKRGYTVTSMVRVGSDCRRPAWPAYLFDILDREASLGGQSSTRDEATMTGVPDNGGCSGVHAQGPTVASHDVESARLDALHEENEVLLFLLGKTHSITSDDTSSVTSTSSSSHSHSQTHGDDTAADWSATDIPDAPSPEFEPICESASEDDACSPQKPELKESFFPAAITQWARVLAEMISSTRASPPSTGPTEAEARSLTTGRPLKKPLADDPEDGDPQTEEESKGLRQRRRTPPMAKSKIPTNSQSKDILVVPTVWEMRLDLILAYADLIFATTVLVVLCSYCAAIGYRFFYPVVYPLPNVDALFKPWDVSNVTARFVAPLLDAEYTGAVPVDWEIANFPAQALREGGVEPFEYQLFLDDRRIQFEVSYWSMPPNYNESVLNATLHHRLRPRDIDRLGRHELRLEITFPIPGSDGELHTLAATTTFTKVGPGSSEPSLQIKSPVDGAVVETSGLYVLLLEFEAHNVHRVDVILDRKSRLHMANWSDGNLLLRGLGVGNHSIVVEAFNSHDTQVSSQSTRIEVRERADPSRLESGF